MQTVMEILAIIITLGAVMILWVIIRPYIVTFINWYKSFNDDYNKWDKNKHK